MAKNATKKPKVESTSQIIRTSDGQTLRLTVSMETVQPVAREACPSLIAHIAKMAEVTNA